MGADVARTSRPALAGQDRRGGPRRAAGLRPRLLPLPGQPTSGRGQEPGVRRHLRLRQRFSGAGAEVSDRSAASHLDASARRGRAGHLPCRLLLATARCDAVAHVAETARPARLAAALGHGRFRDAGALLNESHVSLRDLYAVSSPELDLVTDLARDTAGCYVARMIGAGFGGSAIALVDTNRASAFVASMTAACAARTSLTGQTFACHPAAGASLAYSDGLLGAGLSLPAVRTAAAS